MSFLSPKIPTPPPPPPAPPPPAIEPAERDDIDKEETRLKRRKGVRATMLTGPAGLTAEEDTSITPTLLGGY
tara:strand:- start:193 stop:408 length:216 start_codon:yes stop_codon:yes gene_type:complete